MISFLIEFATSALENRAQIPSFSVFLLFIVRTTGRQIGVTVAPGQEVVDDLGLVTNGLDSWVLGLDYFDFLEGEAKNLSV